MPGDSYSMAGESKSFLEYSRYSIASCTSIAQSKFAARDLDYLWSKWMYTKSHFASLSLSLLLCRCPCRLVLLASLTIMHIYPFIIKHFPCCWSRIQTFISYIFFSSVSLHCNVFARVRAQITHACLPGRTRLSSQFAFLVIFKWKSTYKTVCCRSVFALCCCDCVVHACSDCNYLALFCIIFFFSLFCCAFETRFDRINHDVFLDNFSWS